VGKDKGKVKDKDKGKGKSTYYSANPGRPKSFQPTQQDRQRTGNIAEYFRRMQNTPKARGSCLCGCPNARRIPEIDVEV
jgi:hypothetical protein